MSESERRQIRYNSLLEADGQNQPSEATNSEPVQANNISLCKQILIWRRYLILILTPILLMPLPIAVSGREARCAYCILIMAVYWVTEVVELAVTALLPLVLFPFFGVLGSKQVSTPYFKDTNVLFLGGLIVAVAVEQWNLHKRIALRILLLVGVQPRRLMLGVMLTTGFLSMWISNTATTAMMVPIVEAVLREIRNKSIKNRLQKKDFGENIQANELQQAIPANASFELAEINENQEKEDSEKTTAAVQDPEITSDGGKTSDSKDAGGPVEKGKRSSVNSFQEDSDIENSETHYYNRFCKGMMLAVAYAANVGGTATLTGTGPNLVFGGQVNHLFPESPGFSFAMWFGYSFPQMVILLFVAWIWIQLLFLGFNFRKCFRKYVSKERRSRNRDNQQTKVVRELLENQYRALGTMSFAEKAVLGHFILLALLWLFREPKFMDGWSIAFQKGYVRDATAAMTVAFSLFVFPSQRPRTFAPDGSGTTWKGMINLGLSPEYLGTSLWMVPDFLMKFIRAGMFSIVNKRPSGLLEFRTMSKKFPWHLVILLGSGFALAEACKESGLSEWVGTQLKHLDAIPPVAIVICICVMITTFTEFTSNVATATIFLPILAFLGEHIRVHPWYLMLPATISCSFAFMLPVATPPNAIVFAGGYLKVKDMAKAGFGMNILAVIVLVICINTYGVSMFGLDTFPAWASSVTTPGSQGGGPGTSANVTLLCQNMTST